MELTPPASSAGGENGGGVAAERSGLSFRELAYRRNEDEGEGEVEGKVAGEGVEQQHAETATTAVALEEK